MAAVANVFSEYIEEVSENDQIVLIFPKLNLNIA